ncbi:ferritin-like domain-containing protein [soil metagenome]
MLNSLKDLYAHQLRDLYSAETQLIEALPKMSAAATNQDLKKAFQEHLEETRIHAERIAEICQRRGIDPTGETCNAMKGLITEAEKTLSEWSIPEVCDAALIANAQRVEHYEMAGYGATRTYAGLLDYDDDKDTLEKSLDEEGDANQLLTKIATGGLFGSGLNKDALKAENH